MNKHLYILGILLLLISCKEMNDNIEAYLERGEINYLGRPDSAYTKNGVGRIQLLWLVNEDPRIEGCTISYNDGNNEEQSVSLPVDRSALANGYANAILEVEEGSYVFKISHTGSKGYPSIPTEVTGKSYGPTFWSTLEARRINVVTVFRDRVEITWAAADKTVTKVLLTYETNNGQKTVEVAPSETITTLTDNKIRGQYSHVTYHVPEEGALDEYPVASNPFNFLSPEYPLDKTGWTATANASHTTTGGGPGAIIDGSTTTFWSSPTPGGNFPSEPYYVQIDMQGTKYVKRIQIDERNDVRQLEVRSSLDNVSWTLLGTVSFDPGEHFISNLVLDENIQTRYLRFVVVSSGNTDGRGAIWEVNIIGYEE
jgi:hypothetical protein